MKLKRQVFSYPYIVWMLIFILVPMLLIVLFAFRSDEGLTLGNITSVLSNEIYMEVLWSLHMDSPSRPRPYVSYWATP